MKYIKWRCTSNPLGETAVMKAAPVAPLHDRGFYLGKHLLCLPCWVQVCSEAMCTWTWQCLECKSHTGTHDFLLFSPGKSNSSHQLVISKLVHSCTFFFFFLNRDVAEILQEELRCSSTRCSFSLWSRLQRGEHTEKLASRLQIPRVIENNCKLPMRLGVLQLCHDRKLTVFQSSVAKSRQGRYENERFWHSHSFMHVWHFLFVVCFLRQILVQVLPAVQTEVNHSFP